MVDVRKGQTSFPMTREEFHARYQQFYFDPDFDDERDAIGRLEEIAWQNYLKSRKAPRTTKAGPGFADPEYKLSDEWRATRDALLKAEAKQKDPATKSRVLVIAGSSRNDGSCPGEISKTFRLVQTAEEILHDAGMAIDRLDLSQLTSDYARKIHPCKACVSTAMPLCHWPCSCYPNHALGEVNDWMAEIYERFVSAHGVMIVTPVYWDQAPGGLKSMMDRLVCADGGNPDPTSTSGKKPEKAKAIELAGWDYPKHLSGRAYGVVVHGDASGVERLAADPVRVVRVARLHRRRPCVAAGPLYRVLQALRDEPRGFGQGRRHVRGSAQCRPRAGAYRDACSRRSCSQSR